MTVLVGLDIGGTKIAAQVSREGCPPGRAVCPTDAGSPDRLIAGVVAATTGAMADAGISNGHVAAVGVGVPGQVDPLLGTVRMAVNLNLTEPYPLRDALQSALGAPVALENDVRAATLGALHWVRLRESIDSLAYLSIGTGIAAGLVLDGELYRGPHGMAGEIGHIPLDPAGPRCGCGVSGCLEALAAGPAIAAYAADVVPIAGDAPITTEQVYALAAEGNAAARHVVERAAFYLCRAVYLLVMAYDVDRVVLGGGVTRAGESFERPLRAALAEFRAESPLAASMLPDHKVMVLPPDYSAGLMGALMLAEQLASAPDSRR